MRFLARPRRGDEILAARNCHKSVYHAIEMQELRPFYIYPGFDPETQLNTEISADEIQAALREHPGIRAVVIVSPTYDGIVSDVEAIAEAVHAHGIPLIVDEAHGAHFGFHPFFPENSNTRGADTCDPQPAQDTAVIDADGSSSYKWRACGPKKSEKVSAYAAVQQPFLRADGVDGQLHPSGVGARKRIVCPVCGNAEKDPKRTAGAAKSAADSHLVYGALQAGRLGKGCRDLQPGAVPETGGGVSSPAGDVCRKLCPFDDLCGRHQGRDGSAHRSVEKDRQTGWQLQERRTLPRGSRISAAGAGMDAAGGRRPEGEKSFRNPEDSVG